MNLKLKNSWLYTCVYLYTYISIISHWARDGWLWRCSEQAQPCGQLYKERRRILWSKSPLCWETYTAAYHTQNSWQMKFISNCPCFPSVHFHSQFISSFLSWQSCGATGFHRCFTVLHSFALEGREAHVVNVRWQRPLTSRAAASFMSRAAQICAPRSGVWEQEYAEICRNIHACSGILLQWYVYTPWSTYYARRLIHEIDIHWTHPMFFDLIKFGVCDFSKSESDASNMCETPSLNGRAKWSKIQRIAGQLFLRHPFLCLARRNQISNNLF